MTTIPTQNAVPSEAPRDLKFNSGKIDEFVTSLEHEYKDRFGRCHMTIEGMKWMFDQLVERFKVDMNQAIIAAGYIPMDSFQQGAEITKRNEILRDETTGEYYRWDGDLPKSVPVGSTPESVGGVGVGKWVGVGDANLRQELTNNGDRFVKSSFGDSIFSDYALSNYRRVTSGSFQDGGVIPDPFYGLLDKDTGLYWVYSGNFSAGGHLVTAGTVPDYPDYLCIGKMCADRFDSVINWGAKNNYNIVKGIGDDAVDAVNLASYHAGKRFEATGVRQSVFFPAGTYLLDKTTLVKGEDKGLTIYRNQEVLIFMHDGVIYHGEGDSTVLYVADGIVERNKDNGGTKGYIVFGDGIRQVKNVTITNMFIDLNGDNNLMIPYNWSGAQAHCPAIACYEGSDGVKVRHVNVSNGSGANIFIFQAGLNNKGINNNSFNTIIEDCLIYRVSDAIPGNDKITDHSSIRIESDGYYIRGVKVIQPSGINSDMSCAFELHGYGTVTDCHTDGMRFPFLKANDAGTVGSDVTIKNCSFEDAGSGLVVGGIRDHANLVTFDSNTGTLRSAPQKIGAMNCAAITNQSPGVISAPQQNLQIEIVAVNNTITQKQRTGEWSTTQLASNATYHVDKVAKLHSSGNVFTGFYAGIHLGHQKENSSYYFDDTVISCGVNGNPQLNDNTFIRHTNRWDTSYRVHIGSFYARHKMVNCLYGGYLALLSVAAGVANGMTKFTGIVDSNSWLHPMLGNAPSASQSYHFNMSIESSVNTAAPMPGFPGVHGVVNVHSVGMPHVKQFHKPSPAYTGWWFKGELITDTPDIPTRPFGNVAGDRYDVLSGADNIFGYIYRGSTGAWVPMKYNS